MENNEILPTPEGIVENPEIEAQDTHNEKSMDLKVETDNSNTTGAGMIAAAGLNDAQAQVQGISMPQSSTSQPATQMVVPDTADDVDLIEKEWVKRAKDIVAATQGDPAKQNNQINKMKVEYIKKRYNKEIKYKEE
ncbi:MAG: 1-aminocyclopropane-1-carboxylate deaminase [Candidatus Saccharimonadales bacterium]|jgi:1-aminocyclopropane-1-carboxylate deaminase/D-cysteine desulfhydrase-like pyridoxal-dependent ACC family enzyme